MSHTIEIERKPFGGTNRYLISEVLYNKGGPTLTSSKGSPRGYYLRFDVRKIEERDGYQIVSYDIFGPNSRSVFLGEANRFSRKRLEQLAAGIKETHEYKKLESLYVEA